MVFLANYNSIKITQSNKLTKIKSNISKKRFIDNVKKAKKYIKIGDIFQVVLSQRFECKLTKKNLLRFTKNGAKNQSFTIYVFF